MISHNGQLVMQLVDDRPVMAAIPSARQVYVENKRFLVVPHEPDTCKVLKNLGLNPPEIKLNFKYTGRYNPFKHQERTVEFLVQNKRSFVLNDMGLGKTSSALWAAEYLLQKGIIKRVCVVCPLSVLSVWNQELFTTIPHRTMCLLHGSREKRLDLLAQGSEFCVINHDGVTVIADELSKAGFDLWIVDEGSVYRNHTTRRYKVFKELTKKAPWMWLMTGTPTPTAPTDAWALMKLVNPTQNIGGFTQFKELTMRKISNFVWVPKADSNETVFGMMQPAIRFKKEECLDLPSLMYLNRDCSLTKAQSIAYNKMKEQMVMERSDGEKITAANAAVKLLKLIQICCGVVRDNDQEHVKLDATNRLDLLKEVIEEANNKVIVFVPFIGAMNSVKEFLLKNNISCELVNGDVSQSKRAEIFNDFQRSKDPHVLIAHPKTASHGLNLTAASTIIWYGPTFSVEQYLQANNRINRPGQRHSMAIVHIVSTPIEAAVYRALSGKVRLQDALLAQYEEVVK